MIPAAKMVIQLNLVSLLRIFFISLTNSTCQFLFIFGQTKPLSQIGILKKSFGHAISELADRNFLLYHPASSGIVMIPEQFVISGANVSYKILFMHDKLFPGSNVTPALMKSLYISASVFLSALPITVTPLANLITN